MKKLLISILTLLIMLSGCSNGNSQQSVLITESTEVTTTVESNLTNILDSVVDQNNFCGTTCIYYNGEKIYEGNRGYADKDKKIENRPSFIYRIGSLSKQFTATGICILYDEGKLDINDTLDKYFPECSYGNKVSIKNLLNMNSGIPTFTGDYYLTPNYTEEDLEIEISANNSTEDNKKAIKEWILSQELIFEPEEKFDYSNSNYTLLGHIIEQVSGKSYENFISERIFTPLNMSSTSFDSDNLNTKGYVYDSEKTEEQALQEQDTKWTMYPGVPFAIGDICSSVDDLYKWISALKNGEVLKKETLDMMFEANSFGYGFGFYTTEQLCYHSGSLGTYMSEINFLKQRDLIIITLTNTHSNSFYNNINTQLNNAVVNNRELLPQ